MYEFITIVSGLPRSGTSLMMQMLDKGGMDIVTDNIRAADKDNPKGYYEFEKVKKIKEDASWLKDTRGKAFKMVSMLLYDLPSEEKYKIIFMQRNMKEILASQVKMLANRGEESDIDDATISTLFAQHVKQVEDWMHSQPHVKYMDVDYNVMLINPEPQVHEINRFLGGHLDEDAMLAVVDPNLYRQRK